MNPDIFQPNSRNSFCTAVALALCALLAAPLAAQDKQLILTNDADPIDLTGAMEIDANGNIVVTPSDPSACTATGTCEGVEVEISDFTANNEGTSLTVNQGQSITFRWSSRGAYSCDGGGLPGWTGTDKLPTNTSGQIVPTGSLNPNTTYTATLSCSNGTVVADPAASVDITIEEDTNPPPPGCENRTMPSSWNRMTTGSNSCSYFFPPEGQSLDTTADCRYFQEITGTDASGNPIVTRPGVWPFSWEESTSLARVLGVPNSNNGRHYIAMEFNSGDIPIGTDRQINTNQPQTAGLDAEPFMMSISRCPGDFNEAAIEAEMGEGCIGNDVVIWGGPDQQDTFFICGLEENTQYYLNFIFTNSPIGTSPSNIQPNCTNPAGCGIRVTPSG
jgi:hypothetical protein